MGNVTTRVTLKAEANSQGLHNVRLRVTADRISRYLATPVFIPKSAFNPKGTREKLNWVRGSYENYQKLNDLIRQDVDRLLKIIHGLNDLGGVNAEMVKQRFEQIKSPSYQKDSQFDQYALRYINRMGDTTTADTYTAALNFLIRFCEETKTGIPTIDKIDVAFLRDLIGFAKEKVKPNTLWLYFGRIKTIYFAALDEFSLPLASDPFRKVKVKKSRQPKDRLSQEEIKRLEELELTPGKPLARVRDLCLLMYYAQGMRIGDALDLRKRNYVVENNEHRLIYIMEKTGKPKNVLLRDKLIQILKPYIDACQSPDDPIFHYLRKSVKLGVEGKSLKRRKTSVNSLIDKYMPILAEKAKIDKKLHAHLFRHSFADLARRKKVDTSRIQMALGHNSLKVTQEYLREFDQNAVDEMADIYD